MYFLNGLDGVRTVNLQYSCSFLLLDVLLKTERGDEECNKGSERKKARTLRDANNMYEELKKVVAFCKGTEATKTIMGHCYFLTKKIFCPMPYVKKHQTCKFTTKHLQLK